MQFTWGESKRALNLKSHELDFAGFPVSIVHTENEYEIRIVSFRKATKRETEILHSQIRN